VVSKALCFRTCVQQHEHEKVRAVHSLTAASLMMLQHEITVMHTLLPLRIQTMGALESIVFPKCDGYVVPTTL
jgi:hypothetical protein